MSRMRKYLLSVVLHLIKNPGSSPVTIKCPLPQDIGVFSPGGAVAEPEAVKITIAGEVVVRPLKNPTPRRVGPGEGEWRARTDIALARLRSLVDSGRILQCEVADRVGVHEGSISFWLSGKWRPKGQRVVALEAVLAEFEERRPADDESLKSSLIDLKSELPDLSDLGIRITVTPTGLTVSVEEQPTTSTGLRILAEALRRLRDDVKGRSPSSERQPA